MTRRRRDLELVPKQATAPSRDTEAKAGATSADNGAGGDGAAFDSAAATEPLTIDELAAQTGVPSRTIRFYQSKGVLPKPDIKGRIAYYSARHVERLGLIAKLKDRGLSIRAIRDLLARVDRGELNLSAWLGLERELGRPWADDAPELVDEAELYRLAGSARPGLIADLERFSMIQRQAGRFLVSSPGLLRIAVRLERAGIAMDVAHAAAGIVRKYAEPMARELRDLLVARLGDDDGIGAEGLSEALATLRPLSQDAVRLIFGHAVSEALKQLVSSGRAVKLKSKKPEGGASGSGV